MRVILIGNYIYDKQESMRRYSTMLHAQLAKQGIAVDLISPQPLLGKLKPGSTGLSKWLGYIDKFIIFPFYLRKSIKQAKSIDATTLFHICDHSNSIYTKYLQGVPHLITCHDLLAVRSALGDINENKTKLSGRILQKMILNGLGRAKHVVCVSDQTRRELLACSELNDNAVKVIPNPLNYPYEELQQDCIEQQLQNISIVSENYFFHIGGNQWYKNRVGVIKIFAALTKYEAFKSFKLVMAGKSWTDDMNISVEKLQIRERIVTLSNISNLELNALYCGADALLFPSLAEGFGWPLIEAQASGCPVITSNRSPMKDIVGDAAVLIDPENPQNAAEVIAREFHLLQENSVRGVENSRLYHPDKIVSDYVAEYLRICDER